jgi:5-methylcytosine-specific restriction endonuclease McrA
MGRRSKNARLKRRLWEEVHNRGLSLPVPCHWCRCPIRFEQATVDHVRPKSEGGADDLTNVVVSCADCNHLRDYWNQKGIW